MRGHIGIEIRPPAGHHDLAQQPGFGELMERVVHGGERNAHAGRQGLGMQFFGGDVTVGTLE